VSGGHVTKCLVRDVPAVEAQRFAQLLATHGLDASAFHLREEQYQFDYGTGATLVFVTGPTSATYSKSERKHWLAEFEAQLKAGLYSPGEY
jgi:hypothetical protein